MRINRPNPPHRLTSPVLGQQKPSRQIRQPPCRPRPQSPSPVRTGFWRNQRRPRLSQPILIPSLRLIRPPSRPLQPIYPARRRPTAWHCRPSRARRRCNPATQRHLKPKPQPKSRTCAVPHHRRKLPSRAQPSQYPCPIPPHSQPDRRRLPGRWPLQPAFQQLHPNCPASDPFRTPNPALKPP